jgi:hypothetical protein
MKGQLIVGVAEQESPAKVIPVELVTDDGVVPGPVEAEVVQVASVVTGVDLPEELEVLGYRST